MRHARLVLTVVTAIGATIAMPPSAQATTASCFGRAATIVGTDGNDRIDGTDSPGADVIVTLGGDDTVLAGGGNDRICTGTGNDGVNGMQGDDLINVGPGDDGAGGGYGSDRIYLGSGNDTYDGDAGGSVNHLDTVWGQAGKDTIDTDLDSPMNVYGGTGDDSIRAFSRWSDTVRGGRGADTINVRDFDYYDGIYTQSDDGDIVRGGRQPEGTTDSCVVNTNDTVSGCEDVETHDDT